MFEDQFNSLKLIAECPVCKKKNFPADISLIEARDEGHLVHVRCRLCGGSLLVLVNFQEQGINILGVLTDLGSDEVAKFNKCGPLSADDMISIYKNLNNKKLMDNLVKVS